MALRHVEAGTPEDDDEEEEVVLEEVEDMADALLGVGFFELSLLSWHLALCFVPGAEQRSDSAKCFGRLVQNALELVMLQDCVWRLTNKRWSPKLGCVCCCAWFKAFGTSRKR